MKKSTLLTLLLATATTAMAQLPYQNPALSAHERAVDLCSRLTITNTGRYDLMVGTSSDARTLQTISVKVK